MEKQEIVRLAMLKLGMFSVIKDLKELLAAKKEPKFSFKKYLETKYADKATDFMVWVLREVEKGNVAVKTQAADVIKDIVALKGDTFALKYLSVGTIKKLDLLSVINPY